MNITLCYRRVPGDLSSGLFVLNTEEPAVLENFENLSFIEMMKKLAGWLAVYLEAGAFVQRIDRPGLIAMRLPQDEVDLFRDDPAEAIRRRTFVPQTVHIGSEKVEAVNMVPPLLAGHDALVDCFGDVVFVRALGREVECACCGAWAPVNALQYRWAYNCQECGAYVEVIERPEGIPWAGIRVLDLLQHTSADRYFLPRGWNPHGKWITRNQLGDLFNQYNQEKESLSCKVIP